MQEERIFWTETMVKHYNNCWVSGALNMDAIGKFGGIRACFVTTYWHLVAEKKIERIEDLEQEVKDQLKKDAQISASHLPVEEQLRFCMAIWAFANSV